MPYKNEHWKRVKISNKKHKFDENDCFVLTIPEFKEIKTNGVFKRNKKVINDNKLEEIKDFLSLNMKFIDDFYNDILYGDDFILSLIPLNNENKSK